MNYGHPRDSAFSRAQLQPHLLTMLSGRGFVRGCRLWSRGPTGRKNDRPGGLGKWLNWTRCWCYFLGFSQIKSKKNGEDI